MAGRGGGAANSNDGKKYLVFFTYSQSMPPQNKQFDWSTHGGTWSNHTYVALALSSLLATCVVFWSHRRRDIVNTAVMFSPESMYITLDSSTCTSYPSLKRYKCIWRFGKATGLHELIHFFFHNNFDMMEITNGKRLKGMESHFAPCVMKSSRTSLPAS